MKTLLTSRCINQRGAGHIQNQSLLLLEKLNELDLDVEADLCEKLHDDAEHLFRTLSSRLDELQDGN
ncbi:TPA: Rop family plasmid primer RNA-binding protein [Klebsiella pneumoniae]|nr:Rop family plasmid primer RNA-binding protein [Klebsiella pneumoniae]HEF8944036.1 Rop family plasmid primer RNA-binding protein [Klebsiella pneumoniae]